MLRHALREFGLTGRRATRVKAGNNNRHWYVDGYVLRRYRAGRPPATIAYEHQILEHLAKRGWTVAAPIAAPSGERLLALDGELYSLFPRLPGRRGKPEKPPDPRGLGRMLARLHRDLATFEAIPPEGTFAPILEIAPTWKRASNTVDELLLSYAKEEPVGARRCLKTLGEIRAAMRDLDTSHLQRCLIHGDWHAGNLLFQRGEVTGILDFDFAHPDLRVADLAVSAMILDEETAAELIGGYLAVNSLPVEELELLNLHERARCLGAIAATLSIKAAGGELGEGHVPRVVEMLRIVEARWPALRHRIGLR